LSRTKPKVPEGPPEVHTKKVQVRSSDDDSDMPPTYSWDNTRSRMIKVMTHPSGGEGDSQKAEMIKEVQEAQAEIRRLVVKIERLKAAIHASKASTSTSAPEARPEAD
ncbi:hypothetical protein C0991_012360, partial [Blastosporella zonata]